MSRPITELIKAMMKRGWKPGPILRPGQFHTVETELSVHFPDDYKVFHELTGGAGRDSRNAWRGLWPIEHLVDLNRRYPVFKWFPGLVGFANEGFILYAFDFRQRPPTIVSLGLSSSDWGDVDTDSLTFSDWLETSLAA